MANPWFRFYSEFEDDPKVLMMPEVMQLRLVKVFCGRCKELTLTDRQRAFKWQISVEELAQTKALFLEEGFIDENWNPINWNKRQYLSDSSTDRTKRYRERKRTSPERHSDVYSETSVTKRDGLEAEEMQKQIRTEQKRLEERRSAAHVDTPRKGDLVSLSTLFYKGSTKPRLSAHPFPNTIPGLVAAGYTFSNSAPCRDCGVEIDWWRTPKGGPLPMNHESAVVHMETCAGAAEMRKAN